MSTAVCADVATLPFNELFKKHALYLKGFIVRHGFDAAAAEDVVQDVFLMAHKLGGYQPGRANPRTWLCSIALRLAANARRVAKRRCALIDSNFDVGDLANNTPSPSTILDQKQSLQNVRRALDALPRHQRECLWSFSVVGHTCLSIAESEGVPVGTVYSRLHTARHGFALAYGKPDAPEKMK